MSFMVSRELKSESNMFWGSFLGRFKATLCLFSFSFEAYGNAEPDTPFWTSG